MQQSPSTHNHHETWVFTRNPQEVTTDLLSRLRATPRFWLVVLVLAVLLVAGVVGFVIRLQDGFGDHRPWGYQAAIFAFLLTTAQSAPLVSVVLRLAKAHWRRPLARVAELFTLVGLLNFLLFIPLVLALPSLEGRRSIWFEAPRFSPHVWDSLALLFLVICGLGIFYAGALPDLAAIRDHGTGWRRSLCARLALRWQGTKRQWRLLQTGLGVLGAFYFMFLVFNHFLVASDFAMSLVPGWKDAILPAFHALSGLQSAVATVLVTMFLMRTFGGLKGYLQIDQFWGLAKLLLALSLLWFYFWWSGFLTFWYGRTPQEQNLLKLLMFESYRVPFLLAFFLNFITPFSLMLWNPIRKSILGPSLAGASVLVGTFFDRIRLYAASWSIEDVKAHALTTVPLPRLPDTADVLIIVGALAGAVLVYLLGTRLVPMVSIWELKEGMLLQRVRPFLKTQVRVLAKPE